MLNDFQKEQETLLLIKTFLFHALQTQSLVNIGIATTRLTELLDKYEVGKTGKLNI